MLGFFLRFGLIFFLGPLVATFDFRLPSDLIPISYDINLNTVLQDELNPDNAFAFNGTVKIKIKVDNFTQNIVLHSRGLNVDYTTIEITDYTSIKSSTYDEDYDLYVIELTLPLWTGDIFDLELEFSGFMNPLSGLTDKSYKDKNGKIRYSGITNLKPFYLREIIPCFDEPEMKATFHLTVQHSDNVKVLSNTEVATSKGLGDNIFSTEFQPTEDLSPFMLNFALTDMSILASNEDKSRQLWTYNGLNANDGIKVIDQFDNCIEAIRAFTHVWYFFDKKQDLIAFPSDNLNSATPGLFLFRESDLFFDPTTEISKAAEHQLLTIAEHVARIYFGGVVTENWWSENWLSEGFAKYMAYKLTDMVQSDWREMENFKINVRQKEMSNEYLKDSRYFFMDINTSNDILTSFDDVTKLKGAAIVQMIENFLSTSVFQDGLKNYLTDNQYQAVTLNSLAEAFQGAVDSALNPPNLGGYKLIDILKSWNQEIYPEVNVQFDSSSGSLTLSQKTFSSANANLSNWIIPINLISDINPWNGNTLAQYWLGNTTINVPVKGKWVIVNNEQTGYYRVNYDIDNWNGIIYHLTNGDNWVEPSLSALTKSQLLDDSFSLANVGSVSFEIPLKLANFLKKEIDFIPWLSAIRHFQMIAKKIGTTDTYTKFSEFVIELLKGQVFSQVGNFSTDDDYNLNDFRSTIDLALVSLREPETIGIMENQLNDLRLGVVAEIVPDFQLSVYCGGVTKQSDLWNFLKEKIDSCTNPLEKANILISLGCSQDNSILEKYFTNFLTNDRGENEKILVIYGLASNTPTGINYLFEEIIQNFPIFKDNFPTKLQTVLQIITERLGTQEQLKQLEKLVTDYPEYADDLSAGIETLTENIEWNDKYLKDIDYWLTVDLSPTTPILVSTDQTTISSIETTTISGSFCTNIYHVYILSAIMLSIASFM